MPFVRHVTENRPLGIPAVTDFDVADGGSYFDTVSVVAVRALPPGCGCKVIYQAMAELRDFPDGTLG